MSIESYVLKLQQEKNPGIIEKLVLEFLSGLSWLYGKGVNKRRIKASSQGFCPRHQCRKYNGRWYREDSLYYEISANIETDGKASGYINSRL